jgi:hypothetical protein
MLLFSCLLSSSPLFTPLSPSSPLHFFPLLLPLFFPLFFPFSSPFLLPFWSSSFLCSYFLFFLFCLLQCILYVNFCVSINHVWENKKCKLQKVNDFIKHMYLVVPLQWNKASDKCSTIRKTLYQRMVYGSVRTK